jgi:hypothetical protein
MAGQDFGDGVCGDYLGNLHGWTRVKKCYFT